MGLISFGALFRRRTTGWLPDPNDPRDLPLGAASSLPSTPPAAFLPHHGLLPLYQKGNSCTGRVVHAVRIGEINQRRECPELSGLHNYYLSRHLWGGTGRDGGSHIRSAIQALAKYGAAPASLWPEQALKVQKRPTPLAQRRAHKFSGIRGYYRLNPADPTELKRVLASGYALFGGWRIDKAFLDDSGSAIIDRITNPNLALGHAWVIDGYTENGLFHMQNSWRNWRGTAYSPSAAWMTSEFVAQASDLWAVIID